MVEVMTPEQSAELKKLAEMLKPPEDRMPLDNSCECLALMRKIRLRRIDDNLGRLPTVEEVIVLQFLRPNGKRRLCYAPCNDRELVKESRCMFISAEADPTLVTLYGRYVGDDEENELIIASANGPEVNDKRKTLITEVKKRGV